jgi:excisionase family DNA binding protein
LPAARRPSAQIVGKRVTLERGGRQRLRPETGIPDLTARTVTVADAARLLGISRSLAYLCVQNGELPSVRLGSRIVVPFAAIEDLLVDASRRRT